MSSYTREELEKILEQHRLWLDEEEGGERADLQGADLQEADLRAANLRAANLQEADLRAADFREADLRWANFRWANLQGADLQGADLQGADLQGANFRGAEVGFSAWPLCYGSLGVKTDTRIAAQLAYHFCRLDCDDPEYIKARNAILPLANRFHRIGEPGVEALDKAEVTQGGVGDDDD